MTDRGTGQIDGSLTAAAPWPSRVVVLASRALPGGRVRDRYRREFLAELYGMSRTRQTSHSLTVLSRVWSLRMAVTDTARLPGEDTEMSTKPRIPLLCRLNLHHTWRTHSAEDGGRFRRCTRCGKDKTGSGNGPGDWASGVGL